ncbi:hypothetical protein ID0988_04630 [Helicobacter pylori]
MAITFDNNNNNSDNNFNFEWQILFDKINNSSPFGIIREILFSFSHSYQLKQFLDTTSDLYGQSSAQNIRINEIAKDLESGKIVGKKIINNALSGVSCCFMDDENLKNLKKLLSQDQIHLSNAITTAINQAEKPNGINLTSEINLTSAIIDKIEYHFRDNTFHFILNVSNNFSNGKSRLTIEVSRSALELAINKT